MPNYCENDLFVFGNYREFLIQCHGKNGELLDFNQFIPMPSDLDIESYISGASPELKEKYKKNEEKHGYRTWYDWRRDNWGTKWNAADVIITERYITKKYKYIDNGILIKFDTAWAPPYPVIQAMSIKFPNLKFVLRYYECGVGFKGRIVYKNGNVISKISEEYDGRRGG